MTTKDLSFLNDLELHLVNDEEKLRQAFEDLSKCKRLALDTETEGLSPFHHHIVGVIIAPSSKVSYYFPLRHKIGKNVDEATFVYYFKKLCEDHEFILFNSKFDWKMIFHHWKIDFKIAADAQIQAYILNSDLAESKNLSLKHLTKEIFGIAPLELSDFGEYNFSLFDPEEAYKYACPDGTNTYALYDYYEPKIEALNLRKIESIELSIIKPVASMELNGIRIDTDVLRGQMQQMKDRIDELTAEIFRLAGHEFDIASAQQMAKVFYDELEIKPLMRGKEEDRSVGAEILKQLSGRHPIIDFVKNYREVTKLYNDFILKLPECIAEDSRLHGEFNATGTRSGRFSASGGFGRGGMKIAVNLQQLPKGKGFEVDDTIGVPPDKENLFDFSQRYDEDDVKKLWSSFKEDTKEESPSWKKLKITRIIPVKVRDALIPTPGYYWVSADYSQLEYRTLANMAHDENLIKAFMDGIDFHSATASDMLGVPVEKVSKSQRKIGKTINFGIVYGMTKYGLAQKLENTPDEAQILMDKYFKNKPKVLQLVSRIKDETKHTGYVRTYFGRIRWFKDKLEGVNSNKEDQILKQAFNTYIQGSAADMAKIALARVAEMIKPYGDKIRLLSQVHDEINFEVHESVPMEEAVSIIDAAMSFRNVVPGWADVPADIEIGDSYGRLKGLDEFGIDINAIISNNKFIAPDVDELFKPLPSVLSSSGSSTVSNNRSPSQKKETPSTQPKPFVTRDQLNSKAAPSVTKPSVTASQTISQGRRQAEKMESQKVSSSARIDLKDAKFDVSTVVIYRKETVDESTAFNTLKKFISSNFGTNDLVLENDGMLYRFPEEYRISDSNIVELESAFEVKIFKSKPKIKIQL